MTTTTATDSAGLSVYNPVANVGVGKSEMGQQDFLRLLTAQMQTQDPFEPVNNAELVSQMATITNSSGIAEMNASLAEIKQSLSGTRLGDAASWIGRAMLVQSNIAAPDAAGQYAGQITLAEATDDASIQLLDGEGNVVKTIDLGAQDAGPLSFYWDGKDDNGETVASSALQVKVVGATTSQVATWATIAAVQSPADGSSSKLITSIGTFSPTDAISLT
ncbi:flagellar basal-body rod modification protein FlgD [Sphingobium fontiphilum]|uniref:Basal-body rod modification protein FlgD n=1 Tax=Sphingobium fontiphilum TaxID=944425 RepID=A0A7W6DGZ8_9SPHN|nr:flagellar hook capping FlgD N-terminal domain-containing protein [Sphingobium fontiphilum]MBB3982419.1 flagellar basal-body rod modification protein FlgD [Sphingobium fontiphilum]